MKTEHDQNHQYFMSLALEQARIAYECGEVPIGAIIVHNGEVISTGYNKTEQLQQSSAHAEIEAIELACTYLGSRRLHNTQLYVTLEPCSMCAGAIILARIPTVIYGAKDIKSGAVHSLYTLLHDTRLNHQCTVIDNILGMESQELLSSFFASLRAGTIKKSSDILNKI
jgi:tRNA(adenine34) deaminase